MEVGFWSYFFAFSFSGSLLIACLLSVSLSDWDKRLLIEASLRLLSAFNRRFFLPSTALVFYPPPLPQSVSLTEFQPSVFSQNSDLPVPFLHA